MTRAVWRYAGSDRELTSLTRQSNNSVHYSLTIVRVTSAIEAYIDVLISLSRFYSTVGIVFIEMQIL